MGKASIVYVIGLSLVLGIALFNINKSSTDSMDTYTEYYGRTMAHNIAVAGANIATSALLVPPAAAISRTDSFAGGTYTVRVDSLNPMGDSVAVVSTSEINLYDNIARDEIIRDTIVAKLRHRRFAEYAYFSQSETRGYFAPGSSTPQSPVSMWKITGDSLFGKAHTNGRWNLSGSPYFEDRVTAQFAANLAAGANPIFNAGYQWQVFINRPPGNMTLLASMASAGGALLENTDVGLTFFASGNVNVRIPPTTGITRNDTIPISSLTSNGVVAVRNGDVRVKGTYHGQITVVALKGTSAGNTKGNVWIDGNIVAATNPNGNPSSNDMLGLVAERMAYVTTFDPVTGLRIPRTSASVLNIQAAIYTHEGTFAAERYNDAALGLVGRINQFGSLAMAASTSTGTMGAGGVISNGFLKTIRHDPRYDELAPPGFPASDSFILVSWWEK
jgi:hypothetical protein